MAVTCHLCPVGTGAGIPPAVYLDHLRLMHPEQWDDDQPECWPDGGIVVLDESVGPADFSGEHDHP